MPVCLTPWLFVSLALAFAGCASDPPPTVTLSVASAVAMPVASAAPAPPPPPPLELPGVDTHALTDRERTQWSALVRSLLAPCPAVAVPVAQCVQEKRDCKACTRAATWVARGVAEGKADEQIRTGYQARFDPVAVKSLPIDGSPVAGAADAPVTLVEFVDLQCPHCRAAALEIDALLVAYPGRLRVVFKSFVLSSHAHAEAAVHAAFAAGKQGKFWEMEHALLEGQEHLEARDIEAHARKLKLDMARFRADAASPDVATKAAQDRQLGVELGVQGTPTVYVNGRELSEDDSLEGRVSEEL